MDLSTSPKPETFRVFEQLLHDGIAVKSVTADDEKHEWVVELDSERIFRGRDGDEVVERVRRSLTGNASKGG